MVLHSCVFASRSASSECLRLVIDVQALGDYAFLRSRTIEVCRHLGTYQAAFYQPQQAVVLDGDPTWNDHLGSLVPSWRISVPACTTSINVGVGTTNQWVLLQSSSLLQSCSAYCRTSSSKVTYKVLHISDTCVLGPFKLISQDRGLEYYQQPLQYVSQMVGVLLHVLNVPGSHTGIFFLWEKPFRALEEGCQVKGS